MNPNRIVESMFGSIDWEGEDRGFLKCPGIHLHTAGKSDTDCRVITSGAPTIYCFHTSCSAIIEEANLKMRRAMRENSPSSKYEISNEDKAKIKRDIEAKKKDLELQKLFEREKANILKKYALAPVDLWESSPTRLTDDKEDWRMFLKLFEPTDIIWNGPVIASGTPRNAENFKLVEEWLWDGVYGQFTCPSTFKPETYSRANENVVKRKFLVIESDTLSQEETCAVFNFCKTFMKLRAAVYTGGKSIHGWFEFPEEKLYNKLKITLPALGCDPALFKPSQPVRMPGIARDTKMQTLLYLNLNAI